MKNLFLFAFLVFALTGLLAPSTMSDVFSDKGGNEKAQGDPQGCDNEKGKDAQQNPNCNGTSPPGDIDTDGDGIPDSKDACPDTWPAQYIHGKPDHDGDGIIDAKDDTPCR